MKETDSSTPTPEQLLQILDAGIQAQRARSRYTRQNRLVFLTIGILFILTGAAIALVVLSQLLDGNRPVYSAEEAGFSGGGTDRIEAGARN